MQSQIIETQEVLKATPLTIIKRAVRSAFWGFLNRLGLPGFIQPFEFEDLVTGQKLKFTVSPFFTVISIDGRDYYFYRHNGKFDGTGSGCG